MNGMLMRRSSPAAPARTSRFRPATSSYWPTSDPTVTPGDMSGFGLDQPHAAVRPPEDDGHRPRRGEPEDEERRVAELPRRLVGGQRPHRVASRTDDGRGRGL